MATHKKFNRTSQAPESVSASLAEEFQRQRDLFEAQPPIVQRFLEVQGRQVAEAYTGRTTRVHFALPDRIVDQVGGKTQPLQIPADLRQQQIGKFSDRIAGRDVHVTLKQRLAELESSPERGVVISSGLIRYASAMHMIQNMLPAGKSVVYTAAEGEEIASIPVASGTDPESAITAETDAIAEERKSEDGRGSLQVPYVPAARRFYLPQWVAFDDQGRMLVGSVAEAEGHVASMQRFLDILFAARSLAPFMVADQEFEKKRYGMLGQLVNQGRALARYMTTSIIETIRTRAADQSLNRGLELRLPYFDDQDLVIKTHHFVVIPAGRIMFVPAFVVRAAQEEQAKVAQDTRLNPSTRKYLLAELSMLETAFKSKEM
jgi:hypothetical protein